MKVTEASGHFLPADRVPLTAICDSARAAYEILGERKIGGLIARDSDLPLYYVTAAFLNWSIRLLAQQHGLAYATLLPLRNYLLAWLDANPIPGGPNLSGFAWPGQVPGVIPVAAEPLKLEEEEPPPKPEHEVHAVVGDGGRIAGWHFNHEAGAGTIQTAPPVWWCTNAPPHSNAGPDSGKCRSCGRPLL